MASISNKPRVLFISPNPPIPLTSAANQRSYLIMKALRGLAQTDLLLLNYPARVDAETTRLLREEHGLVGCAGMRIRAEFGLWRFLRPLHSGLVDHLAKYWAACEPEYQEQDKIVRELTRCLREQRYDAIVVRYLRAASRSGALNYAPVILDVDDLDTQVCRSELDYPGLTNGQRRRRARRLQRLTPLVTGLLTKADYLWVSNIDNQQEPGLEQARWLPNIPFSQSEDATASPPTPNNRTIMVIGALNYAPNVAGVDFFVQQVWPGIHQAVPDARFRIVGVHMPEAMRQRWSRVAGVKPVGFVADLGAAYADCAFTVVPVFTGGGTHVKVLESLMHLRVPVVTEYGLRGYTSVLRHNESVYRATSRDELVAGCVKLLRDSDLCASLAAEGRRLVKQEFHFERIRRTVEDTLQEALRRSPVRRKADLATGPG